MNNPNNRCYQPRAYTSSYMVPERVYQYTASVQRELPAGLVATAAYVGSQGRNLFLRSIANRIVDVRTNPNPAAAAIVIREFDIVERGRHHDVQRPYAEVDYKTSGGHDSYNAMQLSLARRFNSGLTLNAQYTLGTQLWEHGRFERGAHRGQQRAHAGRFRLRQRLQQLRRPPHVQRQRALLAAVRQGAQVAV